MGRVVRYVAAWEGAGHAQGTGNGGMVVAWQEGEGEGTGKEQTTVNNPEWNPV